MSANQSTTRVKKVFNGRLLLDAWQYASEVADARGISMAGAISQLLLEHKRSATAMQQVRDKSATTA